MAKKPSVKKPVEAEVDIIEAIRAYKDANGSEGGLFISYEKYADKIEAGEIVINEEDQDENGLVPAWLPEQLHEESTEETTVEAVEAVETTVEAVESESEYSFEFPLDNNVPLPKALKAAIKKKYPTDLMEIGQSFFLPRNPGESKEDCKKRATGIVNAANTANKAAVPGKTRKFHDIDVPVYVKLKAFTTREVVGGMRIWRIAID